jgi:hypothetical protein
MCLQTRTKAKIAAEGMKEQNPLRLGGRRADHGNEQQNRDEKECFSRREHPAGTLTE